MVDAIAAPSRGGDELLCERDERRARAAPPRCNPAHHFPHFFGVDARPLATMATYRNAAFTIDSGLSFCSVVEVEVACAFADGFE